MKHLSLAIFATALLGGCATVPGECDPANRDVSIITKMRCDGSGGYRNVVDQKETELVQAREENALFRGIYDDIHAQRASLRQSVDKQRASQAALVASTNKLLATLKTKSASDAKVKRQLAQAEKDLKALQTQPAGTGDAAAKQAQLQALQQTVLRLQGSMGYSTN